MYPIKYKNTYGFIQFPKLMVKDDVLFTDIFGKENYLCEREFLESDFKSISLFDIWKECERVAALGWKAYPVGV